MKKAEKSAILNHYGKTCNKFFTQVIKQETAKNYEEEKRHRHYRELAAAELETLEILAKSLSIDLYLEFKEIYQKHENAYFYYKNNERNVKNVIQN